MKLRKIIVMAVLFLVMAVPACRLPTLPTVTATPTTPPPALATLFPTHAAWTPTPTATATLRITGERKGLP